MAANLEEAPLSEVDLGDDTRRHVHVHEEHLHVHRSLPDENVPVHRLHQEKELHEIHLPSAPISAQHRNGSDREYPVDVPHDYDVRLSGGYANPDAPANVTVTEHRRVVHTTPGHVHPTEGSEHTRNPKEKKRVKIFSGFGHKKGHTDGVEGREGVDTYHHGHEKNGGSTSYTHTLPVGGAPTSLDYDRPTTLTVYLNYLKRPPGILRILQLLVGVIVCAAVNAERCISNSVSGIVCGAASSPLWYGQLGGQGYVLFVGIIFILGNFALIFYHICSRPESLSVHYSKAKENKFRMAEIGYDLAAVIMYIIAASVETWYATWDTLTIRQELVGTVVNQQVRNVYQPQWIAAAVFAWFNVILYAISIVILFMARRKTKATTTTTVPQ